MSHRHFYTQTFLRTNALTQKRFYTQTPLHTQRPLYIDFNHTHTRTHTLLQTTAFTHTCSELSLRTLLWSASDVQKQSSYTWQEQKGSGADWKENSFVATLKNGIKSIEARKNAEIYTENRNGHEIHRSLRLRQLCRKIHEKSPSSVHVLNSKILMWFSLKNGMVVFGLATPHHDSKIAGTFAQQLGWVFVGPCHPSAHGPPAKLRSFTSLQMVHTRAPQQRGFLSLRQMRWRWRWKGNGNEMTMEMRWQLLNRDTRRGTQKRGKGKTPTPTHLAQSGQTLKGQGKRKSGRTASQTPTRGGGADRSAWHNLQGESQNLPRHAKYPNLT